MKNEKFLVMLEVSIVTFMLLAGCNDQQKSNDEHAGTDSVSDEIDAGSDTTSEPDSDEIDAGSDTASDSDSNDTDSDSDTGSEDTDTPSDSETDTCGEGDCAECSAGPCCDGDGNFKDPSAESCEQSTEYRCLEEVCGSSRQYRIVERFCSGASADCSGDTSDPAWSSMPDCEATEICEMDQDNVATCRSCGEAEICESGTCSCEFETCLGVCCSEGHSCRWTDMCGSAETKLIPWDGRESDQAGYAVSIDGNVAIIGAHSDDTGTRSGSAYIFVRTPSGDWIQRSKLVPSDGATDDLFGYSVSINGDVAIIGARKDDDNGNNSGSAYIFERNDSGDWSQKSKLLPSDGAADDLFGNSVSVSGEMVIIGARYDDDVNGDNCGSAYVFERNASGDWIQTAKLLSSDGAPYDNFGHSVSLSGDAAIVGATYDDDNGENSGSAYIFERDDSGNWLQNSKLIPSGSAADSNFGRTVSISGGVAIVGAFLDDANGTDSGSAYIFERNDWANFWSPTTKLLPSDGAAESRFGRSVSVSGNVVVVGAYYDDASGNDSGSAYIFKRDDSGDWMQKSKLIPSDGAVEDFFGISVSVSGDVVIVGASYDDDKGSKSGSAYIF